MEREIKFRGWHSAQKKMFSAETMAIDQLTLLPTGSFINVHGVSTRLSQIYPRNIFIPLQFTGLKDKNGVEIYEGDILAPMDNDYKPEYKGNWRVIYYDNSAEFCARWLNDNRFDVHLAYWTTKEFEIIGNIYENPELLKEI